MVKLTTQKLQNLGSFDTYYSEKYDITVSRVDNSTFRMDFPSYDGTTEYQQGPAEEIVSAVGDIRFELQEEDPMSEDEIEDLVWEG